MNPISNSYMPSIMTVRELIDTAFGDPNGNIVHHKLIQTILIILARQLRLLERRVEVELGPIVIETSGTSLSVTEVKLHANVPRKKKIGAGIAGAVSSTMGRGGLPGTGTTTMGRGGLPGTGTATMGKGGLPGTGTATMGRGGLPGTGTTTVGSGGKATGPVTSTTRGKIPEDGQAPTYPKLGSKSASAYATKSVTDKSSASERSSTDKSSSGITSSGMKSTTEPSSSLKTSTEKSSSDKTKSSTTDVTSTSKTKSSTLSSDKTTTGMTSSDKTTTELTTTGMTSSDKTTTGMVSSDKTTSEMISSDKTISGMTSSDKTTTDKSATDKSTTDKSATDKSTTDKSTTDKSITDKSTTDRSSTEKSTTDRSTADRSTTDKSTTERSTTDKSATDITTTEDMSTTDKTTTEETSTTGKTSTSKDKSSTDKTSSAKSSSDKSSVDKAGRMSAGQPYSQSYQKLQEQLEEQREMELRIIHQRADSREDQDKVPTPMASMDEMEKQYEKLLIVERVPTGEADSRSQTGAGRGKMQRLSVVTQEEFVELTELVRQLQNKFAQVGTAGFPENAQLMDDLRKGASLTDAMAALQLAARVEAAEKALQKMLSLVTDLASKTPGVDVEEILARPPGVGVDQRTEVLFGADGMDGASGKLAMAKKKAGALKDSTATKGQKSLISKMGSKESFAPSMASRMQLEPQYDDNETTAETPVEAEVEAEAEPEKPEEPKDLITYEELDNALQEMYDEFLKIVNTSNAKSNNNANNALKIATKIESKLDEALDLGDRMYDLETLVSEYAEQINTLDTGLSSQMTYYQEQLTQMQHDLETGLETMAEALANTGGDTAAVAELNNHFTNLQIDFDIAAMRQKDLKSNQDGLSYDLQALWKQIEVLRETKSDRDEVADALKDKAGLAALNGLVSRQEFDAVRGDFEKRIGSAYDKFNNQEVVWQKAIDDLLRELSEKADWIQLVSLQASINQYLEKLKAKIQAMADVVGEPRAATVTRKLHREAECLSCATPAHMELETFKGPPSLPGFGVARPPAIGAEAEATPKEDGDHRVCYPDMPIPHAIDPRSHFCNRYCGGSHTKLPTTASRVPPGMIINPALRKVSTAMGIDGKLYKVDNMSKPKKPCLPCNVKPKTTPEPSVAEPAPVPDDVGSVMTPSDFRPSMQASCAAAAPAEMETLSVTPPPPIDSD